MKEMLSRFGRHYDLVRGRQKVSRIKENKGISAEEFEKNSICRQAPLEVDMGRAKS